MNVIVTVTNKMFIQNNNALFKALLSFLKNLKH